MPIVARAIRDTEPRGRRRPVTAVLGLLVSLVVPWAVLIYGVVGLVHADQLNAGGIPAVATVLSNNGSKGSCDYAYVDYTTRDGQDEQSSVDTDGCLDVYSTVRVLYDPSSPGAARLALKDSASSAPGTDGAWSAIVIGGLMLPLQFWALVAILRRRFGRAAPDRPKRRGVRERVRTRSLPGCLIAGALLVVGLLGAVLTMYTEVSTGPLGFVALAVALGAAAYLGVPRGLSVRPGLPGKVGRLVTTVSWIAVVAVVGPGPALLSAAWTGVHGEPAHGTVTQAQEVCEGDQDSCTDQLYYTVRLGDGQVLPYGYLKEDQVGALDVGDGVEVRVDSTGLLEPEPYDDAGDASVLALIAGTALLVLIVLNASVVFVRRRVATATITPSWQ